MIFGHFIFLVIFPLKFPLKPKKFRTLISLGQNAQLLYFCIQEAKCNQELQCAFWIFILWFFDPPNVHCTMTQSVPIKMKVKVVLCYNQTRISFLRGWKLLLNTCWASWGTYCLQANSFSFRHLLVSNFSEIYLYLPQAPAFWISANVPIGLLLAIYSNVVQ